MVSEENKKIKIKYKTKKTKILKDTKWINGHIRHELVPAERAKNPSGVGTAPLSPSDSKLNNAVQICTM